MEGPNAFDQTAYLTLLVAVAPTFVVLACGFGLRRLRKLEPAADPSLLRLAINFLYPCFIADTVLTSKALEHIDTVLLAPTLGAGILVLSYGLVWIISRLMRLNSPQPHGTFVFSVGTQNWGYLPIPIIQAIAPSALGVLFVHNIGLELVLWSMGVWILSGEGSWRRAFNAPFLAMLASLILNLLHAKDWTPGFILQTLHFLGQAAIPLSLLLTGATLADQIADGGLSRGKTNIIVGSLVRLAVLPMLTLSIARWLPMSVDLKYILVVQATMPGAMVPVILTRHYKADTPLALGVILITTLLGLLTIPLWLRVGFAFVGL